MQTTFGMFKKKKVGREEGGGVGEEGGGAGLAQVLQGPLRSRLPSLGGGVGSGGDGAARDANKKNKNNKIK